MKITQETNLQLRVVLNLENEESSEPLTVLKVDIGSKDNSNLIFDLITDRKMELLDN